jgi:N-acyl-D-aspartate/D-glutamate deacylase
MNDSAIGLELYAGRANRITKCLSFCNDREGTSPEGLLVKEFPHLRTYGTFQRVLRKYVREERR